MEGSGYFSTNECFEGFILPSLRSGHGNSKMRLPVLACHLREKPPPHKTTEPKGNTANQLCSQVTNMD